jgi:hypothetical protein
MDEDDSLLQQELHWSPNTGPRNKRKPPGANAITAIGMGITLVLWAITGRVLASLFPGPSSSSGMIDPKAIPILLVFGAELFVAGILAGRVWAAIGSRARAMLRPIGMLGPLATFVIFGLLAVWVIAMVAAPFLPKDGAASSNATSAVPRESPPVTSGRNWNIVPTENGGATYAEALEGCSQADGRVPSREDLALFDPPFPQSMLVWLAKPEDSDQLLALSAGGQHTGMARNARAGVVCIRP